jgi:tripartite ATP-independent transporter DctM subunit
MLAELIPWLMLIACIVLIILGCPVGIGLASVGIIFGVIGWGIGIISLFPDRIYSTMTSFELAAVTLFVLMGVVLECAGVAKMLFESLRLMFARVRGGLLLCTMLLAAVLAACTGVSGASVVMIGMIALPTLLKYGNDKSLACGIICGGGGLAVIIPPSIMLVLYGPIAGLSTADLFTSAVIPGLFLTSAYMIYIWVRCKVNPSLAPMVSLEERDQLSTKQLLLFFFKSFIPTALLIVGVLGSILVGYASPTEAAGVGSLLAFIIAIFYRKLNKDTLLKILYTTVKVCSMIMLIVVGAGLFTSVFMGIGGGDLMQEYLFKLLASPNLLLVVMLAVVLILGFFMDWIAILYITGPIFRGVVLEMGWDPLWFAMLYCVTLQISYVTPPFSYSVFYLKGITPPGVTLKDIYRGVIPLIPIQVGILIVLYLFPILSTWLPSIRVK